MHGVRSGFQGSAAEAPVEAPVESQLCGVPATCRSALSCRMLFALHSWGDVLETRHQQGKT